MADREKVIKGLEELLENMQRMNQGFFCDVLSSAIELLKEQEELGKELESAMELIHKKNERLKAQPKIVRCKDCRFYKDVSQTTKWIPCIEIIPEPNWYCADGEAKHS